MFHSPRRLTGPLKAGVWLATMLAALIGFAPAATAQSSPPSSASSASPAPSTAPPSDGVDVLGTLNSQLAEIVGSARASVVSIEGHVDLGANIAPTWRPAGVFGDMPSPFSFRLPVTGSGFLLRG